MNFFDVEFETSFGRPDQLRESDMPEIVFSGRSNVGKSSMINKIFNRKQIARVSSVPGKTATINFFKLGGIRFVDLPGYGYAKVSKSEKERWSLLMDSYFKSDRDIAVVFLLMDIRHNPTKDDIAMTEFLIDSELPFVIILTKRDKLSKAQFEKRMIEFKNVLSYGDEITMIPFSAMTGEGSAEIHAVIEEASKEYTE